MGQEAFFFSHAIQNLCKFLRKLNKKIPSDDRKWNNSWKFWFILKSSLNSCRWKMLIPSKKKRNITQALIKLPFSSADCHFFVHYERSFFVHWIPHHFFVIFSNSKASLDPSFPSILIRIESNEEVDERGKKAFIAHSK